MFKMCHFILDKIAALKSYASTSLFLTFDSRAETTTYHIIAFGCVYSNIE